MLLRSEQVAKGVVFFFKGDRCGIGDFTIWFEGHSESQLIVYM
jgi:hypothetical protein